MEVLFCVFKLACAIRLRCRGTLSGGLALSRFVAALLQGLNCLAVPLGVGPFRSVSRYKQVKNFSVHWNEHVKMHHLSGWGLPDEFACVLSLLFKKTKYLQGSDSPNSGQKLQRKLSVN